MNFMLFKSLSIKTVFILVLILIFSLGCSSNKPQFKGEPLINYIPIEDSGYSQEKLDSLQSFVNNNMTTTGMVILKDGKLLFKYGDIEDLSYIASCRKSILSILYGEYVENGTIDLNQTIKEIGIDEDKGLTTLEKSATIFDIINSRSGVFYEPVNSGSDNNNILERNTVNPGEYFVYNNWDYNVAGYIFEKLTGKDIYQEMEEKLAKPLGFEDWNIEDQKKQYNKSKSRYPAYHMYISVRDMAKIGQLMLNKGKWKGKQLVSESWIEKTTTTSVTSVEEINKQYNRDSSSFVQYSYGYMWWIVDNINNSPDFEGAYTASGFAGQYISIIPKLNIVVAHKHRMPTLVKWGLKQGNDVPYWQYWRLLHDYLKTEK